MAVWGLAILLVGGLSTGVLWRGHRRAAVAVLVATSVAFLGVVALVVWLLLHPFVF